MTGVLKYWTGSAWAEVEITAPVGPMGPTPLVSQPNEPSRTDVIWYDTDAVSTNPSISSTVVDAKGDLIVGTADNSVARLAVGATNGQVLTVDSTQTFGVKWSSRASTLGRLATSGGTVQVGLPGWSWGGAKQSLTFALPANTLYFTWFYVTNPINVNTLCIAMNGATTGNTNVGIYATNSDGQPTGPVLASGTHSYTGGGNTFVNMTVNVDLQPGVYTIANVSSATINRQYYRGTFPFGAGVTPTMTGTASYVSGSSYPFTYGTLPTNPTNVSAFDTLSVDEQSTYTLMKWTNL